jgi:hypothetical protein
MTSALASAAPDEARGVDGLPGVLADADGGIAPDDEATITEAVPPDPTLQAATESAVAAAPKDARRHRTSRPDRGKRRFVLMIVTPV